MREKIKYWALSAFVFLGNAAVALAGPGNQENNLGNLLDQGSQKLIDNAQRVIVYAEIICVIAGVISVAWALMDRDNRQEAQNQRLLKVGIGLIIAFVLLLILSAVLNGIK